MFIMATFILPKLFQIGCFFTIGENYENTVLYFLLIINLLLKINHLVERSVSPLMQYQNSNINKTKLN